MSWYQENIAPIAQDPIAAGMVGSVLSLKWAPGKTWTSRAFSVGCGMSLSFFGLPGIIDYCGITAKGAAPLAGLLVGIVGCKLLSNLVDWVVATKFDDIIAIFRRKPL